MSSVSRRFKKQVLAALAAGMILLVPSAQAMVTTGEENGDNYTMVYPLVYVDDAAAQEAINANIGAYLDRFRDPMENGVEHPGTVSGRLYYESGRLSTETKYEDDNAVSITITDYRSTGGAHGNYVVHAMTYNKHTGEKMALVRYLRIRPSELNAEIYEHLFNSQGQPMDYKGKENPLKQVPADYFLLPDGGIAIQFQPYQMGSYADGATTLHLDADLVAYYNEKNR